MRKVCFNFSLESSSRLYQLYCFKTLNKSLNMVLCLKQNKKMTNIVLCNKIIKLLSLLFVVSFLSLSLETLWKFSSEQWKRIMVRIKKICFINWFGVRIQKRQDWMTVENIAGNQICWMIVWTIACDSSNGHPTLSLLSANENSL